MPNGSSAIVQKLWNYCNVLRDDGMSYGDYVEQLTYQLFLKMADERSKPPYNQPSQIPDAVRILLLLSLCSRLI
ncbi:MAG: restriction endonuclease subunit S [Nitrospira sp.]|nr:restriction endonuclease subunit S [Nitrospira sp.]